MNPFQIQSGGPSGFDGMSSAPIAQAAAGPDLAPLLAPGFVQGVDRGGLNETNPFPPARPPFQPNPTVGSTVTRALTTEHTERRQEESTDPSAVFFPCVPW